MKQTVAIPTAIAAQMILTGEICKKGVVVPTTSDIYEPILEQLKKEGIQATVESKTRKGSSLQSRCVYMCC